MRFGSQQPAALPHNRLPRNWQPSPLLAVSNAYRQPDLTPVGHDVADHQTWLIQGLDIASEADHDAVFGRTASALYGIEITS